MAVLTVEGIQKSFSGVDVLRDISFSLEKGEALAIIGSSGSGKTTLLRCLNFLETPDKGVIRVGDQVIFDAEDPRSRSEQEIRQQRLHFGLVFQSFNLFPQYTVLANVTGRSLAGERLTSSPARPPFSGKSKRTARRLDSGPFGRFSERRLPHQPAASSKRVAIARALALRPDILCFDEPTSALDPELTGEVLQRNSRPGPAEHHHGHRHPRDAVCPAGGGQRDVHGWRRYCGIRPPGRGHRQSQAGAHPALPGALRPAVKHRIYKTRAAPDAPPGFRTQTQLSFEGGIPAMARWEELKAQYRAFQACGLTLDMSWESPPPEQLVLSAPILAGADMDYTCEDGSDARNYNHPWAFLRCAGSSGEILGVAPEQVIVGGTPLNLLSDVFTRCVLLGRRGYPLGAVPRVKFICPSPHGLALPYAGKLWRGAASGAKPRPDSPDMDQVEAWLRPCGEGADLRAHVRQSSASPSATRW